MISNYTKSEIRNKLSSYFTNNNCKNLYKDSILNYKGKTKDTNEPYSKVIVDYLVEHIEDFKNGMCNITVTRNKGKTYKTKGHDGISTFDFYERPKGERREEKIAHAMYCQYKDKSAAFGKILDYQIPLKNTNADKGLGKIDLLSVIEGSNPESWKIYFLELKKDYKEKDSKETLLRCILESYTYSKTINKVNLCKDFSLPYKEDEFVIAPLVHKGDGFENQLEYVRPLIKVLDIPVEIFVWEYKAGKYTINKLYE